MTKSIYKKKIKALRAQIKLLDTEMDAVEQEYLKTYRIQPGMIIEWPERKMSRGKESEMAMVRGIVMSLSANSDGEVTINANKVNKNGSISDRRGFMVNHLEGYTHDEVVIIEKARGAL